MTRHDFPVSGATAGRLAAAVSSLPGVAGAAVCDGSGGFVAAAGTITVEKDCPLATFVTQRALAMTEIDDLRGAGPAVARGILETVVAYGPESDLVVAPRTNALLVAVMRSSSGESAVQAVGDVTTRYLPLQDPRRPHRS
ncbi:MAG: hypothetical protein ACKVVT_17515 [Dehalococcoidia bacterium]